MFAQSNQSTLTLFESPGPILIHQACNFISPARFSYSMNNVDDKELRDNARHQGHQGHQAPKIVGRNKSPGYQLYATHVLATR